MNPALRLGPKSLGFPSKAGARTTAIAFGAAGVELKLASRIF
jgi:hypothetical protein